MVKEGKDERKVKGKVAGCRGHTRLPQRRTGKAAYATRCGRGERDLGIPNAIVGRDVAVSGLAEQCQKQPSNMS